MSNVMLHKQMSARRLIYILLGSRVQSRRWLYILVAVPPALLVFQFSMSVYHVFNWSYSPIVFICLWQVFRPTVAGWATILVFYSYSLVEALSGLATEFMDYGSEDHSAWEGWFTASLGIVLTIVIAAILVAVIQNFPKERVHAT